MLTTNYSDFIFRLKLKVSSVLLLKSNTVVSIALKVPLRMSEIYVPLLSPLMWICNPHLFNQGFAIPSTARQINLFCLNNVSLSL